MKRIKFTTILFYLFYSCATITDTYHFPQKPTQRLESEWDGKELVFSEISKSLQMYFNSTPWKLMDGFSNLQYNQLVRKMGRVDGILVDKRGFRFWVIILEDGTRIVRKDQDDFEWGFIDKTYFVEDFENAKKLIGSTLWLNKIKDKDYPSGEKPYVFRNIFDDSENQWTNFKRFQKVKAIEVIPFVYGNTYHGNPFFIKIQADDGELGYVRYGRTKKGMQSRLVHYYTENPIPDKWGEEIITLVKEGKIRIGMTSEQVRVSWGEPDDINVTTTYYTRHEQWIYGTDYRYKRYYVYFDNGILSSYQKY